MSLRLCRMGGDVAKGVHKETEIEKGGKGGKKREKNEEGRRKAPTVMLFDVVAIECVRQ